LMPSVAFATFRQSPDIIDDERATVEILRERGVTVSGVPWDDDVDWSRFDLVVIRSTWDYHLKWRMFEKWVRNFLATPERLWNPPQAVLDNINKRYLIDLAARGVDIVPTEFVATGTRAELPAVLERRGWIEAVVKPAVSGGAHGTWRTSRATADADRLRFATQSDAEDVLVQEYMPEVAAAGEWSLTFLGGSYSHAVLKRPATGDFRVQWVYGGGEAVADPGPALIEQAEAMLAAVGHPLLYARVDGVVRAGRLLLMEMEITEPYLWISAGSAAGRFAEAILRVL
jgi:glutathione synthase/RimK-type ligase-like ATP-grasp enzyme